MQIGLCSHPEGGLGLQDAELRVESRRPAGSLSWDGQKEGTVVPVWLEVDGGQLPLGRLPGSSVPCSPSTCRVLPGGSPCGGRAGGQHSDSAQALQGWLFLAGFFQPQHLPRSPFGPPYKRSRGQ